MNAPAPPECKHGVTFGLCEACDNEAAARALPDIGEIWRDRHTGFVGVVTAMQIDAGGDVTLRLERASADGPVLERWYAAKRLVRPESADDAVIARDRAAVSNAPPEVQLSQHADPASRQVMSAEAAARIARWMDGARERLEFLETLLGETICSCTQMKRCPKHRSGQWEDQP